MKVAQLRLWFSPAVLAGGRLWCILGAQSYVGCNHKHWQWVFCFSLCPQGNSRNWKVITRRKLFANPDPLAESAELLLPLLPKESLILFALHFCFSLSLLFHSAVALKWTPSTMLWWPKLGEPYSGYLTRPADGKPGQPEVWPGATATHAARACNHTAWVTATRSQNSKLMSLKKIFKKLTKKQGGGRGKTSSALLFACCYLILSLYWRISSFLFCQVGPVLLCLHKEWERALNCDLGKDM